MRKRFERGLVVTCICVVALALGLASCSSTQGGSKTATGSKSAIKSGSRTPVSIFVSTGQSDWAFHVASEKGYFTEAGLDVKLTQFASGADAATAFRAQGADMIQAGDLPTVTFVPHVSVSILADTDHHNGVLLVAPKKTASPSDLIGKSIAGVLTGSPGFWIAKYIADNNLAGKVKTVSLQTDAQVAALLKGSVGAVLSTDSTLGPLLARSSDYRLLGQWPSDNFLMANKKFMEQNPDAAPAVLTAIDKAWSFIQSNPADAAAIEAKADGITAEVPTGWLKNGYGLSFKPAFGQQEYDILTQMSKWAASTGALSSPLDICAFVNLDALKKAVPDAAVLPSCPPS